MTGRVEGAVALITGAARGQGRSHAVRLAEEGADIIALDVCEPIPDTPHGGATEEQLAETVDMVEATGRRIVWSKTDVRDVDAMRDAVDRGVAELGRLDIVVANAGIAQSAHAVEDVTESIWQDMLDINLTGVWHTAKVSIPHITAGGRGGSIVLISSAAGLRGFPNVSSYVAAKHGLVGLMRSMAVELAPKSIRVNSIHPTNVGTDMIMNESHYRLFNPHLENPTQADFEAACQNINALPVPWVESIDVSNALLFLASSEARYITGVPLPVDAGVLL